MRDATVVLVASATGLVAFSLWSQFYLAFHHQHSGDAFHVGRRTTPAAVNATASFPPLVVISTIAATPPPPNDNEVDRCAICLFGLPRSFASLVLPSLIENVLKPNARHNCDYFVHYYNVTFEAKGRSGRGGPIDPDEVWQLEVEVSRIHDSATLSSGPREAAPFRRRPVTKFASETDEEFWRRRGQVVQKIRTTKDGEGRYLYFPWKDKSYQYPVTTDNIIKMWHSIQGSWDLMEEHAASTGIEYSRVAMLRSDVLYVTPIDVWALPFGDRDSDNSVAVTPGFGRCPMSDRLIYGPADAVKIWATQRFERMDEHVQWTLVNNPGLGLHSETFVNRALLDPIRELGVRVGVHPTMCFVRARADESVWVKDCELSAPKEITDSLGTSVQHRIETLLGRNCSLRRNLFGLDCPKGGLAENDTTVQLNSAAQVIRQ